jgi:HEAT repeat protein
MSALDAILLAGSVAAVSLWAALSAYVLAVQRRRANAHVVAASVITALEAGEIRRRDDERLARGRPVLERASRELVMRIAADRGTPADIARVLTAFLLEKWGLSRLQRDAAAHRGRRDKWRRTTALRILCRMDPAGTIDLLARAVKDDDSDVAGAALSLLGSSADPRAIDILIGALKDGRHTPSRVAAQLDRLPQPTIAALTPLLKDPHAAVRLWGAALLGRYADADGVERDLAALADDSDAGVRKAAVESLGRVGDELAASMARRLLRDQAPIVRAEAARALGALMRVDFAEDVGALLGDHDWWVRRAAKESLEMMGGEVWPVLVRLLDHPDGFVRNGVAEVFQNLGVLDSLVMMEAATLDPTDAKIGMLRRIAAAGGARFTDSLVERAGPSVGPRVRALLQHIGLEQVGAV